MKKIGLLFCVFFVFTQNVKSQVFNSFSSQPEHTIPEMLSFFESASKSYKDGIDSMKTFFPIFWGNLSEKNKSIY